MNTLVELPPDTTPDKLTAAINDRIRQLQQILTDVLTNPMGADLDMGKFRIVSLSDPKDDLDGVNLRTLKRFQGDNNPPDTTANARGGKFVIVFSSDDVVEAGQEIADYVFATGRLGKIIQGKLYARSAPKGGPLTVRLSHNGAVTGASVSLPDGTNGPVAVDLSLPTAVNDRVHPVITSANGAALVTFELVVE
jgi:hypothetical protein